MSNPFTVLFSGPVPVNQLDALPLITAAQFTDPGGADGVVFGGNVLKYWSPDALGIRNASPGLAGTRWNLHTPWIDTTPCKYYVFTILRYIVGANHAAAQALYLKMQFKLEASETPNLTKMAGGVLDNLYNGIQNVVSAGIGFADEPVGAIQRYSIMVSPNSQVGTNNQILSCMIGPWVRFILDWDVQAPNALDTSVYSMSIIGSS